MIYTGHRYLRLVVAVLFSAIALSFISSFSHKTLVAARPQRQAQQTDDQTQERRGHRSAHRNNTPAVTQSSPTSNLQRPFSREDPGSSFPQETSHNSLDRDDYPFRERGLDGDYSSNAVYHRSSTSHESHEILNQPFSGSRSSTSYPRGSRRSNHSADVRRDQDEPDSTESSDDDTEDFLPSTFEETSTSSSQALTNKNRSVDPFQENQYRERALRTAPPNHSSPIVPSHQGSSPASFEDQQFTPEANSRQHRTNPSSGRSNRRRQRQMAAQQTSHSNAARNRQARAERSNGGGPQRGISNPRVRRMMHNMNRY